MVDMLLIGQPSCLELRHAAEMGFNGVMESGGDELSEQRSAETARLGMKRLALLPTWSAFGDAYDLYWQEWGFKNALGQNSMRDGDGPSANAWPSYWCPDPHILELAEQDIARRAALGLDAIVVTTANGECKFPCFWGDLSKPDPEYENRRLSFWCFDEWAQGAWEQQYGEAGLLMAATPYDDHALLTLQFCQAAMISRLHQLSAIAIRYVSEVWICVGPWVPPPAVIYWAVGYYRLHELLNDWLTIFEEDMGIRPKVFVPAVYNGPEDKESHAHALADPNGEYAWDLYVGGQCDGAVGDPWKNLQVNIANAQNNNLAGLVCDHRYILAPDKVDKTRLIMNMMRS